jgi:hypothetical protein
MAITRKPYGNLCLTERSHVFKRIYSFGLDITGVPIDIANI